MYYIHNEAGKIIYIGKSKNIKKRVLSHLTSKTRKAEKIQKGIHHVTYELCGNECLALLKEQHEIKKNQPRLNHAMKYRHFPMGIRRDSSSPYHRLSIEQVRLDGVYLDVFKNKKEAEGRLRFWLEEFSFVHSKPHLHVSRGVLSLWNKKCGGACVGKEKCEAYNSRVQAVADSLLYPHEDMLIIDKGKSVSEKSFILIKDGLFQGYGYFQLNHQINSLDKIETRLIKIEDNRDTQAVIRSFLRKNVIKN